MDLGRADYTDPAAVTALAKRLDQTILELREHAANEDTFIHPMLQQRAPRIAATLQEEHALLDTELTNLESMILALADGEHDRQRTGLALYRAFCNMLSAYLGHLDLEETVAMPALWDTCTDAEIGAIIAAFVASRTRSQMMSDLRDQLPALTPQESAALLEAVSAAA